MSGRADIDVLYDRPYIVDGLEELRSSKDENLEMNGKAALCRCGGLR